MFGRIFNPENAFFRTADQAGGPGDAEFDVGAVQHSAGYPWPGDGGVVRRGGQDLAAAGRRGTFTSASSFLRLNFKVGALTSLAVLAAAVLLYGLGNFLYRLALTGKAGVVLYYAYLLLLLLPIGMISYLFPVLSRFTFGAGGLIGTCWKLALNHLPSTLLLGLLTAAAAWACLSFWIPVLVLPAVAALLASLPLERIFRPYLELPGGGETEE